MTSCECQKLACHHPKLVIEEIDLKGGHKLLVHETPGHTLFFPFFPRILAAWLTSFFSFKHRP